MDTRVPVILPSPRESEFEGGHNRNARELLLPHEAFCDIIVYANEM